MRSTVILLLLLIAVVGITFSKTHLIKQTTDCYLNIDTSRYAILKFKENENLRIFDKTDKPAELTFDEIEKIEKLIEKRISDLNDEFRAINHTKYYYIKNPRKYYKQFIAFFNSNGEKEVWVNCFCSINDDEKSIFKKEIIMVLDGGSCYFQLKVNLTKNTTYDLTVNSSG
jgi:hypothetical protein